MPVVWATSLGVNSQYQVQRGVHNTMTSMRKPGVKSGLSGELTETGTGTGSGHVDLIGCGPGDPDLLTIKAVKRIEAADVIVRDRLVPAEIVALANPEAKRIDVGKTPYQSSIRQDEINHILLREALKGQRVARLKGGDPGIFGRLAEEMSALRAAGVSVDVIPGITAAHACAAEIGLPVTLRKAVRQFSVLTGATADGDVEHDWSVLARPDQAFAIYMGVKGARVMAERLISHGAAGTHPVVVVENGTRANQRAVKTTLADVGLVLEKIGIAGPAIIFVGLDWHQANLTPPEWVEIFERYHGAPARQPDDHLTDRKSAQPNSHSTPTKAPTLS